MKVKELIELLKQQPEDAEILIDVDAKKLMLFTNPK